MADRAAEQRVVRRPLSAPAQPRPLQGLAASPFRSDKARLYLCPSQIRFVQNSPQIELNDVLAEGLSRTTFSLFFITLEPRVE